MNHFTASPHSTVSTTTRPRTYEVRTFGCQMNVHDSERLAGLLEEAGYVPVGSDDPADVVVFNTCAVRENADNRLYGTLGQLKSVKDTKPDMQIAVGGCMAQKDKDVVVKRAPWVDVVFGTHNIGKLPTLLARAAHNHEAQVEIADALEQFPSVLPAKRDSAYSGWVSVSVGCNNTCTFCIVPSLRGKEKDRRPGDILAEVQTLVDDGVSEVTLLGQNVNAYGVHFEDPTLERDRSAFSKLLRACGDIEGLERVRFTSPHPAEFTSDVIDAMAETHNVCPQLHMPLQSGSDKVLKGMRRSYRTKRFMRILDEVREKLPQASITTDIIVGFPGETEEDFQQTLDLVEKARFTSAYTFQYSPRPGTPAAAMEDQVPKAVVQDRYERLVELQERISAELNAELVGDVVEVLVQADDGRRSAQTHRLSGRTRDGRLVHFAPDAASMEETARAWDSIGATPMAHPTTPGGNSVEECVKSGIDQAIRAGDVVWVRITDSRSHFLLSDSGVLAHRRMPAGDRTEAASAPAPRGVGLGMPTIKTMKR
ncbi:MULTISPECIES: tRNA (N6-isopentenyl adenosine(37)-C2)-methylthiotransferase MiaB [Corynebacterium]|uniref:tRNA (N6-isopentenyl adenosine(37)-C2)-methylthiotransferase MiaB n=1 Tax=Corynebacterium TaxID=1716 RepID=UPI00194F1798|nr:MULTISPECIES: tRNA (N6-isopentenyl adenosine(37)-C2)-methylthiotransferase MiaB [Corynebacterium]MBY0796326.1 tRNA (N6-isopentenyl adenosine(37)-C2)-methylthiotransferase MiaB [Corynebacterium parakroppenstedtii]MDK7147521.1 tRNA (N6-isopentenyl adenosine(37)-C2)-methylthiotransferase MiaB [Corynebacterium pseudokroppenstedtii]MDU6479189.1 tRNA (N6-isopentenyl adenosine(37)-C2)-methylthiotransferase MiaB [Corynebacterium kroppenstedtii]QRP15521.1 tRNA (N6-isopentenyl adenosine(37)-C2)-methyl